MELDPLDRGRLKPVADPEADLIHAREAFGRVAGTTDFVSFVGNTESRPLVRRAVGVFRETTPFPSEGLAAPQATPGLDWSDHASFWKFRFPAIMITDTAHFRDPHYHAETDQGQQVDYERMVLVAQGVEAITKKLRTEAL